MNLCIFRTCYVGIRDKTILHSIQLTKVSAEVLFVSLACILLIRNVGPGNKQRDVLFILSNYINNKIYIYKNKEILQWVPILVK
jgi:hypothetical protein